MSPVALFLYVIAGAVGLAVAAAILVAAYVLLGAFLRRFAQ